MSERPGHTPRLFVDLALATGTTVELPATAAHHVARVLRMESGDAVILFDGRGGEYPSRLAVESRGTVRALVGPHVPVERESAVAVTLLQGISSADRMDFTVQKAVELGVAAIQPLMTQKSVVRLSGERQSKRVDHWQRVAIAACEQCGRNRVPAVHEPVAVDRYLPPAEATKWVMAPDGTERLSGRVQGPVILAVGPEAGFTADEEKVLGARGFRALRLGERVLRTETAALAALAAIHALSGEF